MRILKSASIVVSAGLSTVLLAVAARAGLDAGGIEIPYLRESTIPLVCALIVILSFALFRGHRPWRPPPYRIEGHHMIVSAVVALGCAMAMSIWVTPLFGHDERWLNALSLGGFVTAGIMASVEWAALDAAKATRSQQTGDGEP